jgi:hypothetical protein
MIYLFTGSDTQKAREKAFKWIEVSRKKQPEAAYLRIAPEATTEATLEDAASARGLFFTKSLILIDDPFSFAASGAAVLDALKLLAESPNPIAILAPKLKAADAKKLESKAAKIFVFDIVQKKEGRGFNTALVNAFGSRNGKALWLEIERALRAGDAPEMIHGLLHWKARDILQKGTRNWTPAEARSLSLDLIELLSSSRSGGLDLGQALERWALSI